MLRIKDLEVSVENTKILRGINLQVNPGEVHAIMGPNGSGKSTLANVLAGREEYTVDGGEVRFMERDLLDLAPDERAKEGLFMAFQYPVEIPGVSNANFLKTALNEIRTHSGEEKLDAMEFLHLVKDRMKLVKMDEKLLSRSINEGFSGGEKKRNEIFQLAVLDPKLAILDETDSGLDIDALKIVAKGINSMRRDDNAFVVVTHYQRLLNYIIPDKVHILFEGRIAASGDKHLALRLEEEGYDWLREAKPESVTA